MGTHNLRGQLIAILKSLELKRLADLLSPLLVKHAFLIESHGGSGLYCYSLSAVRLVKSASRLFQKVHSLVVRVGSL